MDEIINALVKKGFYVVKNSGGCCYMARKRGATTHYAEVEEFDGEVLVSGRSLKEFLKGL